MRKKTIAFLVLGLGAVFIAVGVRWAARRAPGGANDMRPKGTSERPTKTLPREKPNAPLPPPPITVVRDAAEEKAERIAKIKRDYEELAAKIGGDFNAAGADYPGGLNGYLRQLALLEREKRKDYAAILSEEELENLEMRETRAGQQVRRWLADAPVTDEQRRQVFRLQRNFDDKYALEFDLAKPALLARETERQAMQEKILSVLGLESFTAWARSEGDDFGNFARFAVQQGLPAETALELWRVKNAFTRQNLANQGQPEEERARLKRALILDTRERVQALVGRAAFDAADRSVFAWFNWFD